MRNPDLWNRLSDYDFPEGFRDRLIQEIDRAYSRIDAVAAMTEYRRFVYLAVVSDAAVTPSHRVDDVWHLHLTDTKDYWERFCPDVLKRRLHHIPSKSAADGPRHADQYARTLDLYEEEFGSVPAESYWPQVKRKSAKSLDSMVIYFGMALTLGGMAVAYLTQNATVELVAIVTAVSGVFISILPVLIKSNFRWRVGAGDWSFGDCSSDCSGSCGGD